MEASRVTSPVKPTHAHSDVRQVVADYITLTKPRVQLLLLLTTVATMEIAGSPSIGLILLTLLGGYLSAGGAGAVNHWYDRDIDARMARTANRPIPSGRVSPRAALIYGFGLQIASFALLSLTVNVLAATFALAGFLGYVFVYTLWLKRSTPQNIVIGGAAGAFPPVVGWAAATGSVSLESVILFAIIFLWTPPHFWALALFKSGDYGRAGVPMMPNVAGEASTRRQIFAYALIVAPVAVLPWLMGYVSAAYGAVSIVLGAGFVWYAWKVLRMPADDKAMKPAKQLFAFSILYLFAIYAAYLVDVVVSRVAGA